MTTRRDPFFRRVHPRFRFHDIGVILGIMNLWAIIVLVVSAKNVQAYQVLILVVGMVIVGLAAWVVIAFARIFMEKRFEQLDEEMLAFMRASGLNIPTQNQTREEMGVSPTRGPNG